MQGAEKPGEQARARVEKLAPERKRQQARPHMQETLDQHDGEISATELDEAAVRDDHESQAADFAIFQANRVAMGTREMS